MGDQVSGLQECETSCAAASNLPHKVENHRPLAGNPSSCEPCAAEAALPAQEPSARCTKRAWMGPL